MEGVPEKATRKRKVQELIRSARDQGLADKNAEFAEYLKDVEKNLEMHPRADGREMGEDCREKYIRELSSKGLHLRRIKGRIYETASGRKVGIAYGTERRPDKWFMGLPTTAYDVVVLLCQETSGHVLDFVLPTDFIKKTWPGLPANGPELKINVRRTGNNYDLDPGKGGGKINRYISNTAQLT